MAKALAIDTTDSNLIIVLLNEDKQYSSIIEVGKSGHSSLIIPSIDALLCKANLTINDIDTLGVVVGPGSFTGIRIGVSAITAIAFANQTKRVAISSFELISFDKKECNAAVDAGHGNLYTANCINGRVVSTKFIESTENVVTNCYEFKSKYSREEALIKVLSNKIDNEEYVSIFEPYYMRKSQAEREKDEI